MARLHQILSQRQEQRLELRPKMLQALHLLSLPILELEMHLKQELVTNPMLELQEDDRSPDEPEQPQDDLAAVDAELQQTMEEARELSEILDHWNDYHGESRHQSTEDTNPEQYIRIQEDKREIYLLQLDHLGLTEPEYDFAADLVDNSDEYGFLPLDFNIALLATDYQISPERAEDIHELIMSLEPRGITARDIVECLMAQLDEEQLENRLLTEIIREDFEDLIHRRYQIIASKHHVSQDAVLDCKEIISKLDPKPGLRLAAHETNYMVPDIIVKRIGQEYELIVNDSVTPNVVLNRNYKKIISSVRRDRAALEYVRDRINSAKFLIKSMYLRNRTLVRVMRAIIEHQRGFFYHERGVLEPLTYSVIAAELQLNESTISRVVRTKYADTPFGIMCLRDFFTSTAGKDKNYEAVSRQMVEKHIRELVDVEDARDPVSDQMIADILKSRGISVSRRVIAKYREGMGILNSRLRRKE
jgi:RNA polymerase sigma-54 factor